MQFNVTSSNLWSTATFRRSKTTASVFHLLFMQFNARCTYENDRIADIIREIASLTSSDSHNLETDYFKNIRLFVQEIPFKHKKSLLCLGFPIHWFRIPTKTKFSSLRRLPETRVGKSRRYWLHWNANPLAVIKVIALRKIRLIANQLLLLRIVFRNVLVKIVIGTVH